MSSLTSYNYCKETIALAKEIQEGFLSLASRLHKIKTEKLWEDGFSSWEEFCDEIKLSYSTVQKLIQIYDVFVLRYGLETAKIVSVGGWSILAEGLPIINSKRDAEAFLRDAEVLSLRDIRKTVIAKKKGFDEVKCLHPETYTITICKCCGERWEEYGKKD